MFKYRLLTAIILIPLVLWAIFKLPPVAFASICLLLVAVAAWEWAAFMGWENYRWRLAYIALMLLALILTQRFLPLIIVILLATFWWFGLFAYVVYLRYCKTTLPVWPKWLTGFAGLITLIPCWGALILLQQRSPKILLFLLLLVWITDIAAYFGGKSCGKRLLAPAISPAKTWEGLFIGICAAALFALAVQYFWGTPQQAPSAWILLALPTIVAAIVGDLFESLLKRQQKLKDSGQLLPGHGGLLDRIDSLVAAAPIFICGLIALHLL
jgi:phosphatidate cytidylyltransferase